MKETGNTPVANTTSAALLVRPAGKKRSSWVILPVVFLCLQILTIPVFLGLGLVTAMSDAPGRASNLPVMLALFPLPLILMMLTAVPGIYLGYRRHDWLAFGFLLTVFLLGVVVLGDVVKSIV